MKRRQVHATEVIEKLTLGNQFTRIVAAIGEGPVSAESLGGYVKIYLKDDAGKELVRSISVSEVDEEQGHFTLDFVNHGGGGPVAEFAKSLGKGDTLSFLRPGPAKHVELGGKRYVFVGDATAFAAIKTQLRRLAAESAASAIRLIVKCSEPQAQDYFGDLLTRETTQVTFCADSEAVVDAAKKVLEGQVADIHLWAAADRETINTIRTFLADKSAGDFAWKYTSSYWQAGLADEKHKELKRGDAKD